MPSTPDRILTTHVGSLPRPDRLRALHIGRHRGEPVDEAEMAEATAAAVREVVRRQQDAGIDIGNDGEQQREHFFLHMRRRLSGFGGAWSRPPRRDLTRYPEFTRMIADIREARAAVTGSSTAPPMAIGPIRYIEPGIAPECALLREALAEAGGSFAATFMTAPAPGIVATAMANRYYPSDGAYIEALADALRSEYEHIVDAGFVLQIDAPDLALERAVTYQDQPIDAFLRFVEMSVAAINRATAAIPAERIRVHVCWGNSEAPHDDDVPLGEIASRLRDIKTGAFSLPFANPRHAHEWHLAPELLSRPDQKIVAGVIDTTTNFVEHPDWIAERIVQIAEAVGDPTRVIAGTDCGFDTAAGLGQVSADVVWAKLASLAEGARRASTRLFGDAQNVVPPR